MEGRRQANLRNFRRDRWPRSLSREVISTKREKIAKLARQEPKLVLTTLAHHIDMGWLREAYRRTRKDGAVGVDGVTAAQYETNLEANLTSLLERFKTGRYRAPAVRRVYIPKEGAGNKTRPIGIPTLEDKLPSTSGGHGTGIRIRGGLLELLVWIPSGSAASTRQSRRCGAG